MKKLPLIILIAFSMIFYANAQKTINVADFGAIASSRADASIAVSNALKACQNQENIILTFPKGRYDFWGHTKDNPTGIIIDGLKNVTIDGQESEFVFHGRMMAIYATNCENLKLTNFIIDWDRPLTSQATISAIGPNYMDIAIDKAAYPYIIENGKLRFVGEGWKSPVVHYILFDKDTKDVVTLTRDGALDNNGSFFESDATEISNGIVRLNAKPKKEFPIGTYIALYSQRELAGISLYLNKNTTLENIKIHFSPAGGLLAKMCDGIHFNNVNVEPNEAKGRIFSSMADASYFPNCKGLVKIENCKHTGQADDWANFRGTYTGVKKVNSPRSINVSYKWGRPDQFYNVGDSILFVNVASMQRMKDYVIVSEVSNANEQDIKLVFDRDIPTYVGTDYVVENMTWTPEVIVTDCVIPRRNRARGILLSTPRRSVFENNLFQTAGAAILIEGDTDAWFEAGAVRDFVIRNNVFENCMTSAEPGDWSWGEGLICITPSHKPQKDNEEPYHQNIIIENNVFKYYDYNLLYARSVKGLKFINNTIELTNDYPAHGRKVNFFLDGCRQVVIGGNKYDNLYPARITELHHMKKADLKTDEKMSITIVK